MTGKNVLEKKLWFYYNIVYGIINILYVNQLTIFLIREGFINITSIIFLQSFANSLPRMYKKNIFPPFSELSE